MKVSKLLVTSYIYPMVNIQPGKCLEVIHILQLLKIIQLVLLMKIT